MRPWLPRIEPVWVDSKDDELRYTGSSELYYIYNEVKFIADRLRVQDAYLVYDDEWKFAALVLDRWFILFIFLFLLFILLEHARGYFVED